jgi:hypothetical protein
MTIENINEKIFTKIGRNIVVFQEFESLLKSINKMTKAIPFKYDDLINDKFIQSDKTCLGPAVSEFCEKNNPESKKNKERIPLKFDEYSCYLDYEMGWSPNIYEKKKKILERLVFERNELVHNSLNILYKGTEKELQNFTDKLDIQYKNTCIEIKKLKLLEIIVQY